MKKLFLLILGFSFTSYACDVYQPDQFNFTTSVLNKAFFPYRNNGNQSFVPFFRVNNCATTSSTKKFLMISFGPQNQELSDRVRSYDISNRTRDSGCKILNNPFKTEIDYASRKRYLGEKWRAIKSCYRVVVKDEGNQSLQFPEKQPGCDYILNSKNELEFNGGYCFFSPNENSSYSISFKLKEECLDYKGLKKLDIKVVDFQAILNFYTAGDPSGTSLDLTSLKSFPFRFSVSPNEELFSSSDIFGLTTPQFPANYYLPDTHLGTPEVMPSGNGKIILYLPLWADNNCSETCSNGYCQGLCDYSQPLSGEIGLSEISPQRKVPDSELNWFQGGVIFPRYQGEISGTTHELSEENLQPGKVYRISMTFNDPKFDFQSLKKEYQKRIQRTNEGLPRIGSSSIPTIPQLGDIKLPPLIPEIVQIGNINFSTRISSTFEYLLATFDDFFKFKYWPPHFSEICYEGCMPIKDKYLVLSMDFRLKSLDREAGKYDVEVLSVGRSSSLLKPYIRLNPLMPKIKCG